MKYSPGQMYSIVADVANYKDFVPWCLDSRVLTIKESTSSMEAEAELTVGYSLFREKYVSQVSLIPNESVVAVSKQTNLFEYLRTTWGFQKGKDPNTCWVSFQLEFHFKNALYNRVSDLFFQDIVNNMVAAFEKRSSVVYPHRGLPK